MATKKVKEQDRITYLDHVQLESTLTPGVGQYNPRVSPLIIFRNVQRPNSRRYPPSLKYGERNTTCNPRRKPPKHQTCDLITLSQAVILCLRTWSRKRVRIRLTLGSLWGLRRSLLGLEWTLGNIMCCRSGRGRRRRRFRGMGCRCCLLRRPIKAYITIETH